MTYISLCVYYSFFKYLRDVAHIELIPTPVFMSTLLLTCDPEVFQYQSTCSIPRTLHGLMFTYCKSLATDLHSKVRLYIYI